MAKFRQNHSRGNRRTRSMFLFRVIAISIVLMGLIFYGVLFFKKNIISLTSSLAEQAYEIPESVDPVERFYLPEDSSLQILHYHRFSIGYSEEFGMALWSAYEIDKQHVSKATDFNQKEFIFDHKVENLAEIPGYVRFQLVPAKDLSFDPAALEESFYITNTALQAIGLNQKLWKQLEDRVRRWTASNERLYVITGPVFSIPESNNNQKSLVPDGFYKVLLDLNHPVLKGIGFIIPNRESEQPLGFYARSIDEVENTTGINFFKNLMDPQLESELEGRLMVGEWGL